MQMEMTETELNARRCLLLTFGTGADALFWWGTFADIDESARNLGQTAEKYFSTANFSVLVYGCENWNADYSPWPAPGLKEGETFDGNGTDTLAWLCGAMQEVRQGALRQRWDNTSGPQYSMGYSLAGLFSLWAFYESGRFDGFVCCSGSLWLEGFDAYAASRKAPRRAICYLSLGGKEEHSPNERMARVGDATRSQFARMQEDTQITACTLKWNSGGHFADAAKRLCMGIEYIIDNGRK